MLIPGNSETVKRVLNLPADTQIVWKSHDDSISQRSLIDQAREKPRRVTMTSEDGNKASSSS
jgi:translation initiation factor 4E